MFRRTEPKPILEDEAVERVDSVLGTGLTFQGTLNGVGGVRIEGAFDGDLEVKGLVVIAEEGRVVCEQIRALAVIVAGSVRGNIEANRVEIAATGRVWGDVTTTTFSTQEGAFLRGQIRMEEEMDLGFPEAPAAADEEGVDESPEKDGSKDENN
ncbi:MAG: polymer-forming cytoskeletal protein [Anaerolineales bacterium]|nr:polymer-forming cytoskeletal protein [Anaerolineales bacterium]